MQYKFAEDISNYYLIKPIIMPLIVAGCALFEYLVFDSHYISYLLVFYLVAMSVGFILFLGAYPYILYFSNLKVSQLDTFKVFLRNPRIRYLRGTENNSSVYFLKTNDLIIYFNVAIKDFNALSGHSLEHFKNMIAYKQIAGLSMDEFVVIKYGEDYLSLSSEDISMLDVPFYKMTPQHFKSLQMLKI
jgi:hypothetical protein